MREGENQGSRALDPSKRSGVRSGSRDKCLLEKGTVTMKRLTKLVTIAALAVGLILALQQRGQGQAVVSPTNLARPDYDYAESNGCTRCHFSRGALGDHMPEAVGMTFNEKTQQFAFTGEGWRASLHAQSNYKSTQNTYCAKCHSPLQAKPNAEFKLGGYEEIPDGKVEGVTCAVCHPSHTAAVVLGRRLGMYKWGMDKSKPEAYTVIKEWHEDDLCLTCHVERHNESNPAFAAMYDVGIRCVDATVRRHIRDACPKRFHDFKVARNFRIPAAWRSGYALPSEYSAKAHGLDSHEGTAQTVRDPKDKRPSGCAQQDYTTCGTLQQMP
jgi:hypothetical protein